ncbi:hypothetical protein MMC30_000093 [Trapelia coarctata]|nr:hypothetical protein [Trapelia coarctata]
MAEAAGFVLAGFPILLSAIDHYQDSVDVLGDWWDFKSKWVAFHHKLAFQKVLFDENLEELLSPIFDSEVEIDALLKDAGGSGWQNPYLEKKVKERLPKSYTAYKKVMEEMKETITELQGEICSGNKNFSNAQVRIERFMFPFKKNRRAKLIQKLKRSNRMLQTLLGSSDRLQVFREKRKPLSSTFFRKIHDHACSLHSMLSRGWQCGCRSSHCSKLMLERRIPAKPKMGDIAAPHDSFKVLFSSEETSKTSRSSSWTRQHTNIRILEANEYLYEHAECAQSPQATSLPPPLMKRGATLRFRSAKQAKSVSFAEPQPKLVTKPERRDLKEISDLCTAIERYFPGAPSFGFLCDKQKRRLEIYPVVNLQLFTDFGETVTLENLLLRNKQTFLHRGSEMPLSLSRQQRMCVATTLAYSLLQLHSTPWLGERWSKEDILLPLVYMGSCQPTVVVEQPYVRPKPNSDRIPEDCTASIFSLGVLLLELWFGEALEEQPFRNRYLGPDGQQNEHTDLSTAKKWLKIVKGDAGPDFEEAIRRCIFCDFTSRNTSLAEIDLREEVYSGVVKPVEEVETYLMPKRVEATAEVKVKVYKSWQESPQQFLSGGDY